MLEAVKQLCDLSAVEAARGGSAPFTAVAATVWEAAERTGLLLSDVLAILMQTEVQVGNVSMPICWGPAGVSCKAALHRGFACIRSFQGSDA